MRVALTMPAGATRACQPSHYWMSGVPALDAALGGGFAMARVHEFYAASTDDAGAAAGFAVTVALGMAGAGGSVLTLRTPRTAASAGVWQAAGWADLGGAPERAVFAVVEDHAALLQAAADAMRARALAVVMAEIWEKTAVLDLTVHRRLALAAEKSGVPLLLVRGDASPQPSAAQTRWQIAAAPSRALPGHAPGLPAFTINLLRQRGGPADLDWTLEWDRDQKSFRERDAAPHSGAMVPVPPRRTLAIGTGHPAGERAAA